MNHARFVLTAVAHRCEATSHVKGGNLRATPSGRWYDVPGTTRTEWLREYRVERRQPTSNHATGGGVQITGAQGPTVLHKLLPLTGHVVLREMQRDDTYSAFPYKQKYNTLLKVRTGVTPRYDCTRQLLCCGKACTAPRTKEYRAPCSRRPHKSHKTYSRSVEATFTYNHRTSSPSPPSVRSVSLVTSDTRNEARHRLSQIHSPTSPAFRAQERQEALG